ncbi:hypothetical protein, partial [Micrococcus luteus]|uniref:hypothetical protein n=1 Tax=Micrococcus luteus TaxID=1270 RepID=UPI002B247440
ETKFSLKWKTIIEGIKKNDANAFESQFKSLGEMLGLQAERPEGEGVPDGIWNLGNKYLVFEAKTGYEEGQKHIPPKHIRQASGHSKWVEENNQANSDDITNCIISNRLSISGQSKHLSGNISVITHDSVISLAENLN